MSRFPLPDRVEAITLDVGGVLALPAVLPALRDRGVDLDAAQVLRAHHRAVAAMDAVFADQPGSLDGPGPAKDAYTAAFPTAVGLTGAAAEAVAHELRRLDRDEVPWSLAAPGAAALIPELNRRDVPVAIVSNSNGMVEAQLRSMGICQAGVGPYGQVVSVVDSAVVGVRKPDPAIFDHAFDVLDADRSRSIHVGDVVAFDVIAALAAGITPVHYDATARCDGPHAHIASLDELVAALNAGR